MTGKITKKQGEWLLHLAREIIRSRLARQPADIDVPGDPVFAMKAATFVTLKLRGQLRGCIGTLEPSASLWESIRGNAENAAFHDTRFRPLTEGELQDVHLDISILTQPERLEYSDAGDLAAKLRPRVDGVILHHGRAGATFLPQVWEQLPTPELFLGQLCRKAGLHENFWREGFPEIEIYQVQCFAEEKR
jgi:AmmeMemoRadiSam system protein A